MFRRATKLHERKNVYTSLLSNKLSVELLHRIFDWVTDERLSDDLRVLADRKRQNSMAKLALVNRHWNRVATVHLYYRARIETSSQLRSFTETLRKHPHYLDYLKILSVDFRWDLSIPLMSRYGKGWEQSRREATTRKLWFVLCRLRKITQLHLGESLWPSAHVEDMVVIGKPTFPRLSSTVTWLHLTQPTRILQPLVDSLSSLRKLHLSDVLEHGGPQYPPWDLRTLRISRGCFSSSELNALFYSRQLTRLAICDVFISSHDCYRLLLPLAAQLRSFEFFPAVCTFQFSRYHYEVFMEYFLPRCISLQTLKAYFVPAITSFLPPTVTHIALDYIPYHTTAVVNSDLEEFVSSTHCGLKAIMLYHWPQKHLHPRRLSSMAKLRGARCSVVSYL